MFLNNMVLDKLKFWKKEEIPDYPHPEQSEFGPKNEFGQQNFEAFEQPTPFAPQAFEQKAGQSTEQQIQLISAKLDTIKAQLETVLQKLDSQERKEERPYQQRWKQL